MIVLVTGLMRSGTSLVAKQLHLMGVPMGTLMRFPINGQDDWEDVEFTDMMLARLSGADLSEKDDFLCRVRQYEQDRRGPHTWGVKSPFALAFVEDIREAVEDEVKVILTTRPVKDTYASVKKYEHIVDLTGFQDQLFQSFLDGVKSDLTIDISESWTSPDTVETKLRNLIRS